MRRVCLFFYSGTFGFGAFGLRAFGFRDVRFGDAYFKAVRRELGRAKGVGPCEANYEWF